MATDKPAPSPAPAPAPTATPTAAPTTAPTTVAKAEQPKKSLTIRQNLETEAFKYQLAKILPKHITPERMVRVAITAMTRTPDLAKCTQESFFEKMMLLSQYGLEPNGRDAHLIPYWNSKLGVFECQLIIDYKGLVPLIMRTGEVASIHADVVCDNDDFKVDLGEVVKHEIDYKKPRGNAYAFWARIKFRNGGQKCEVMTKFEVDAIRARSKAGTSGPWVTDYNEMAKKTVFKRASKWVPLSSEIRDVIDSEHDYDSLPELQDPSPHTRITSLESLTEAFGASEAVVEPQPATAV
jgi:recombination protein RecT